MSNEVNNNQENNTANASSNNNSSNLGNLASTLNTNKPLEMRPVTRGFSLDKDNLNKR